MFISAREVNWFISILLLDQFRNLLIAKKLISHLQDVTGNVHPIFKNTNMFGNLFSSDFFTDSASVEGHDSAEVENQLFFHKSNS